MKVMQVQSFSSGSNQLRDLIRMPAKEGMTLSRKCAAAWERRGYSRESEKAHEVPAQHRKLDRESFAF